MASDAIVNLVVNADDAERTVNAQLTRITNDAERRAPDISLNVTIDNSQITNIVNQLGDVQRGAGDADRDTGRLSDTLRSLGSAALGAVTTASRLTVISGIAAGALPVVGALVGTLASIAPAAAAGVTGFVAMKAATATLQIGLTGVADAIGAVFDPDADPAAVAEALENLSDNAQDFVRVLQDMRPAFDGIRLRIQDTLFQGLDKTLKETASATLPALEGAAQSFATTFNQAAKGAAAEAQQLGRNGTLGTALQGGADAFENLVRLPAQLLGAITRLSAGGAPLLERITQRIADFGDSASKALEDASETGALEDAINGAADVIKQLGEIGSNVFGAISNIMSVASESGGGLLDSLERVTQALEDVTGTEAFAGALGALISVGTTLAETVLPILAEAFTAIAPVLETLAPFIEDFIALLGEQLMRIIPELAPVLVELARVFGEILIAVEPLIVAFTDILIAILPALVPLFQQLARLIQELAPLIEFFATGVTVLLIPALTFLIGGITQVVDWLATLIGWITEAIEFWGKLANETLTRDVIPALKAVALFLAGDFSGAWEASRGIIVRWGVSIVESVRSTMTNVIAGIQSGVVSSAERMRSGFQAILNAVTTRLNEVVLRMNELPGRIRSALGNLGGLLYAAGRSLIQGLINGILSKLGEAVAAASKIVSSVRDYFPFSPARKGPFSGRGYTLYSGQKLMLDFARGIIGQGPAVSQAVRRAMSEPFLASPTLSATVSTDARAFAGLSGTSFSRTGASIGNVTVFLGNEQFTDSVQTLVDGTFQTFNRTASQGVRF